MTNPKVLIVSGCSASTTTLYRCVHLQEQLAHIGISAAVREWYNADAIRPEEALDCDMLVLHRVPMNWTLERLIEQARAQNKTVLFDTDDLIFEPALTRWHRGADRLSEDEKKLYHGGVRRYLATLEASDYVLTATPLLAELAQRRGKIAFVHRNALGREMKSLADRLFEERLSRPWTDKVIIGYGSGTPTHDVDFQEAVPALLEVMSRHPNLELWLVGPLIMPSVLTPFENRIRRLPLASWQEWFEIVSHFDINLAPLEKGNLFCRAKSEIKFVEAAALGVPTVASRIDPFEYAVTSGHDGLLAGDIVEWIEALEALIIHPTRRLEMGRAARHTVESRYTLEARAADLSPIVDEILVGRRPGIVSNGPVSSEVSFVPLVINWMIYEPIKGSGGYTDIFRMIKYLVEFGHECHIYVRPVQAMQDYSAVQMKEFVDHYFFPTGAHFHRWGEVVHDADATIATLWPTVYDVVNLPNAGRQYYFVQDFEPYFYSMGTEYIRAENTYRMGLHCITLGPWLARLMRERYGAQADHFDFAVDTRIYWPRPVQKTPPLKVAFYARPTTPRRAYKLGLEALKLVKEQRSEAEIVLYGADHLAILPPFPYVSVGILNEYDLAQLFSRCDIGLVLSLTNPSLVPFEMMACRCAVVDIRSERIEDLLRDGENALLAEPTPQSIADAVLRLLDDEELRQHIIEQAYQQVCNLSWCNSARQVEAVLLRHAPPPNQRVIAHRHEGEIDNILWQIQRLLDERESEEASLARLEEVLHHIQVEKAEQANQLHRVEEALYRLHNRRWSNRLMALVRRWGQKATIRTQAWLGNGLLSKMNPTDQPLHQSFVADRSHLCRIDLLFASYNSLNTRPVLFTLREGGEQGRLVVSQYIHAFRIRPDRPYPVEFEPQPDSFKRTYTFTLSVPGATACDGYAVWRFNRSLFQEAHLRCGARRLRGHLAFQVYFQMGGERVGIEQGDAYTPALRAWGEPLVSWPEKIKQATPLFQEVHRLSGRVISVTRERGIDGLLSEISAYFEWLRISRGRKG